MVAVLFETFGNMRANEAGSAPNADFGSVAGGEDEGFVFDGSSGGGGHVVVVVVVVVVVEMNDRQPGLSKAK